MVAWSCMRESARGVVPAEDNAHAILLRLLEPENHHQWLSLFADWERRRAR